jgi:hypothetical protein
VLRASKCNKLRKQSRNGIGCRRGEKFFSRGGRRSGGLGRGKGATALLTESDSADLAVHEPLALRKITVSQAKEVSTGDHNPPARSAFE